MRLVPRFAAAVPLAALPALAMFLLGACASPQPGHLALPPNASVQRLDYDDQGKVNAAFRVQNYGPKPVQYGDMTLRLRLGDANPIEFHVALGFEVAGHASEVMSGSAQADASTLAALKAAEQRAGAIGTGTVRYRLEGDLVATKPKGEYKIKYDGQLSPEPGLPRHFR
jgi:hypothetical protein